MKQCLKAWKKASLLGRVKCGKQTLRKGKPHATVYHEFADIERNRSVFISTITSDVCRSHGSLSEEIDSWIMENRDHARYRLRDKRQVTMSTLFGEIIFSRRLYQDREKGTYVYLLDQALAFDGQTGISPHLEEWAVELATAGPSYHESHGKSKSCWVIKRSVMKRSGNGSSPDRSKRLLSQRKQRNRQRYCSWKSTACIQNFNGRDAA